jgi:hypothetical protein
LANRQKGNKLVRKTPLLKPRAILLATTAILALAGGRLEAAEPTGELVGTVVDLNGRPVPKAHVVLKLRFMPMTTIAAAETAADGRFRLAALAPIHRAQLFVDAPGFGREHREEISIFPNAANEVRVVVAPGRTVQGRILKTDGQPAANVSVEWSMTRCVTGRYLIERIGPETRMTTNALGEFHVENVPPCRLSVHVSLPDFASGATVEPATPGRGAQTLASVLLAPDVPIAGVVHDSLGKPLAKIPVETSFANSPKAITDDAGRFVLHGFRAKLIPQVSVVVDTPEFVYRRVDVGDHPSAVDVTVTPQRWISGRVVDAQTGEPVAVKRLILCWFTRRPNGEIDRGNCKPTPFEQPKKGEFRVAYRRPDNIHITVQAPGYDDAEANLDEHKTYENIEGLVIKARRNGSAIPSDSIPVARITGSLTRDGRPVSSAWISAVKQRAELKYPYVDVQRGRTVRRESVMFPSVVASPAGEFALELRNAGTWTVLVEEPNRAPTIVGPFEMQLKETRKLDLRLTEGGAVKGRVRRISADSAGAWWVVAFDRTGWRSEIRIAKNGEFLLEHLPVGEIGLKVGHDGYFDPDNPDQPTAAQQQRTVEPWHAATLVQIRAGQTTADVVLDAPMTAPGTQASAATNGPARVAAVR